MVRDIKWGCPHCGVTLATAPAHGCPDCGWCACDSYPYKVSTLEQPTPHGEGRLIWDLVIEDMEERSRVGAEKYGEPLKAFNGRSALIDAYQEALDLVVYLRQEIEERNHSE